MVVSWDKSHLNPPFLKLIGEKRRTEERGYVKFIESDAGKHEGYCQAHKEECDHMEFLKKQSQNKKARLDRLT